LNLEIKNKNVVITGGTKGIGASMVKIFNSAGANIIATGTNSAEIKKLNLKNKKKKITFYQLDLRSSTNIKIFINQIKHNNIDIFINNAGVNKIEAIDKIKLSDWDWINNVNLRGPFILMKEISKIMKKNKYGKILNVSSIFGVNSKEKRAAYSSSKWGLIGLTKASALDLAPYNVLVNSISPGFVKTDLTKKILGSAKMKSIAKSIPLNRLANPDEIAFASLFLCSDMNTYITGQNIIVDGGFTSE